MSDRKKILILERDEFLREIIGNLLHKKGGYILNGSTIEQGIAEINGKRIDTIILGTSVPEFKGKETLGYIKKRLENPNLDFFIINNGNKPIAGIPQNKQMIVEELSIQKILDSICV